MSTKRDIEFHFGEHWVIDFEVKDGDGTVVDITGATISGGWLIAWGQPPMTRSVGDGIEHHQWCRRLLYADRDTCTSDDGCRRGGEQLQPMSSESQQPPAPSRPTLVVLLLSCLRCSDG